MSDKCQYDYGQRNWGGPYHELCLRPVVPGFDRCDKHLPIQLLLDRISELEAELAAERERRIDAEREVLLWATGQHVWEGDESTEALARKLMLKAEEELKAKHVANMELKQELDALKMRLEKAPVTEATYWEIYELHQSPYTRIANMSGNPLKLKPGQSKRVKIVEVEGGAESFFVAEEDLNAIAGKLRLTI